MADSLAEPEPERVVRLAGVVLAAGAGVRLRPLSAWRPKALCPIGATTLVDRAVAQVAAVTGTPVAVNVHHGRAAMLEHLEDRIDVHVSLEEERALGTAGAVAHLAGFLDGRGALVVNADTVHAEEVCGCPGLCGAAIAQQLALGQHALDRLTALTPGGQHEHDPMTGDRCSGHRSAGGDRFVVGMGMKGDDGGHRCSVPWPPPSGTPAVNPPAGSLPPPPERRCAPPKAPSRRGPRWCAARLRREAAGWHPVCG